MLADFRVDADPVFGFDLAAVGARVLAQLFVFGNHRSHGNIRPRVGRVVLDPREPVQVNVVADADDFLDRGRAGIHLLRRHGLPAPPPALGLHRGNGRPVHLGVVAGDGLHAETHGLADQRAVHVAEHRRAVAPAADGGIFDEEGRGLVEPPALNQAVRKSRGFIRILVHVPDTQQMAVALQRVDVIAQGIERAGNFTCAHKVCPCYGRLSS